MLFYSFVEVSIDISGRTPARTLVLVISSLIFGMKESSSIAQTADSFARVTLRVMARFKNLITASL